jgi:uncharacterized protein YvpB
MICRYWGSAVLYPDLIARLGTTPDVGTPFPNLRRLTRYGFHVQIEAGTLAGLYRLLQSGQPVVVAVQTGELPYWENEWSQHAVVVVGMTESTILLNDPAVQPAPIGVSLGDFDLAWLAQGEAFAVITPA